MTGDGAPGSTCSTSKPDVEVLYCLPSLGRWRQEKQEFIVVLSCVGSLGLAWVTLEHA